MLIAVWQRNLIMGLMVGLLLVSSSSCESQSASPPRPTKLGSEESDEERSSNLKNGSSKRKAANDDAEEEAKEEKGSKSRSSSSRDKFDYGGAAIGDDDSKEAVAACHKKGKTYDRFADDGAGACSTLLLAKMNCTESGIKKVLTDRQVKQFEESIGGSYAGWLIDQCGDCPPDSSSKLCESSTGARQTGTKVFFVKENGDEIRGKAMVLPTRPGQNEDTDEDEDEAKEDDE